MGDRIKRTGPGNEKLVEFLNKTNKNLWLKQPYQHEYALTSMFLGFQERDKSFRHPDEIKDVISIFQWIKDLKPEQFPQQEKIKNRPDPLLISDGNKKVLEHQLSRLNEKDFLQQFDSMDWLSSTLRIYVQRLINAGIINKDTNILNEPEKTTT
jgi:hypothetical protein